MDDMQVWKWQFQGSQGNGRKIEGSGTLTTSRHPDPDGWYTVESIQGSRNGIAIKRLYPAGKNIPGDINPSTRIPYTGDNRIRLHVEGQEAQLDQHGIQFELANGTYSNIFFASFLKPPAYLDFHSEPPYPMGAVEPNSESRIQFSAHPE